MSHLKTSHFGIHLKRFRYRLAHFFRAEFQAENCFPAQLSLPQNFAPSPPINENDLVKKQKVFSRKRSNRKYFNLLLFCICFLFTLGAANAAEEKASTKAATAPKAPEAAAITLVTPKTTNAPKSININAGSGGLLSKDALSIHDDSTVRPATDHEVVVMNLVYQCNEAIRNNNLAEAEAQINIMTQLLPRQSLTLLRMQAWYALSAGQDDKARQLYRQLLDRVTNDENAGINLAILEARGGRIDEAKEILNSLTNHISDSEQLNAARQAFGMALQQ